MKQNYLKLGVWKKLGNLLIKNTNIGEIVLLSTGAPSFNAKGSGRMPWKGFEEKGDLFKKYVEKYGK
ncbi:MAG: hypothetical protein Q9M97_05980 [Candidatus Gracilibacteria bacterium]|nr:hypothetical protein [Candidatus Gracilibacteria bacterium]